MSEDKRSAKRVVLRVRATLIGSHGNQYAARTFDISTGGVCLLTEMPLTPAQKFTVIFQISIRGVNTQISAEGSIAYCMLSNNQFKSGLQFSSLPDTGRQAINALVMTSV